MRHEEHGEAEIPAKGSEEVDNGGLHEDVEGRRDLVAHEHLGSADEGAGDGDSLAFAARQLVGVAVGVGARECHPLEHLGHELLRLRSRSFG